MLLSCCCWADFQTFKLNQIFELGSKWQSVIWCFGCKCANRVFETFKLNFSTKSFLNIKIWTSNSIISKFQTSGFNILVTINVRSQGVKMSCKSIKIYYLQLMISLSKLSIFDSNLLEIISWSQNLIYCMV